MHNNKTASKRAQAVPNQIKRIKKKIKSRKTFVSAILVVLCDKSCCLCKNGFVPKRCTRGSLRVICMQTAGNKLMCRHMHTHALHPYKRMQTPESWLSMIFPKFWGFGFAHVSAAHVDQKWVTAWAFEYFEVKTARSTGFLCVKSRKTSSKASNESAENCLNSTQAKSLL